MGTETSRKASRRGCWVLALLGCAAACGAEPPGPPPPPPDRAGRTIVFAVVYGSVTQGGFPVAGAKLKVFASKARCADHRGDTVLTVADSSGRFRQVLQVIDPPAKACIEGRFYFDRSGASDSLVIKDVFVALKEQVVGAVPDSVRVDAGLP